MLAKVAVTGGGRCNVTNSFANITDLKQAYPRGHKLMKRLFKRFSPQDTCQWFEDHGVRLVTQEDQCIFPQTQDAMTIVNTLTFYARRLGVKTVTGWHGTIADFPSDVRLAVCTGGQPRLAGLQPYADMGHDIVEPVPSLFTFNIEDTALRALMGTVVEAHLAVPGTKFTSTGALLVTHWGLSGPAALKLSSYAARHLHDCDYRSPVLVNWTASSRPDVEAELQRVISAAPQKLVANVRPFDLPTRLWTYLTARAGIAPERRWAEVGKKQLNRLIEVLTADVQQITGKGAYKEEFVTAGGVALSSVNANTLESRHRPGLFFAGEVLDVDAITGGFNLQAAWTMGRIVGLGIIDMPEP